MSFGKDPNQLSQAAFSNTSQQMANAQRRTRTKRGGEPHWANNLELSDMYESQVRLVPGQFKVPRIDDAGNLYEEIVPWYEARVHYHGVLKRSSICSAGPFFGDRKRREPCVGCDIFWEDFQVRKDRERETGNKVKNPNRVSAGSRYVFLALDKGYFFKTEQRDENNQVQMNPNTNKPYMEWVKYVGAHQDSLAHGAEGRWGRYVAWPIAHDYFGVLNAWSDVIGQNCVGCGGQNTLRTHYWKCGNCQNPLLDPATAGLDPKQIKDVTGKPNTCRACGATQYPVEVLVCSQCQQPRRASLYDVDLFMRKQQDANDRTQLIITRTSQPGPIEAHFHDLLQKPPDLVKKFAPTPIGEQQSLFQHGGQQQQPPPPPPQQWQGQQYPQQQYPQNFAQQQHPQGAQPVPAQAYAPQQPYVAQGQQAPVATPPATPPGYGGPWGQG